MKHTNWKKRFDKKFVQTYQGITNIDPDVKPDEIKQFIEEEIKKTAIQAGKLGFDRGWDESKKFIESLKE